MTTPNSLKERLILWRRIALIQHSMPIGLQVAWRPICGYLTLPCLKAQGVLVKNILNTIALAGFAGCSSRPPHRQVEEVAAECGLYSLCKLRESFYQHLGIHLEPFVVMSGRALEDLQIRHNNGNDALILKEV